MHVLWDFPGGVNDAPAVCEMAARLGIRIGAINPNVFEDQILQVWIARESRSADSSGGQPPSLRFRSHCAAHRSRDLSLWFADGSNYPGTASIRRRRNWFLEGLRSLHGELSDSQRMLVEYKPFEPAFYHTDIADWGMALLLARDAGPKARVLVDTGHHYPSQNIEQLVAWLLAENMLGGFHFNDRRYADDDLTLGSIDPYQIFRIFLEIHCFEWELATADVAYMVDQSHNLKPKIEEMIQTAVNAQELYAKAALVDQRALSAHQDSSSLIDAEECLKRAFFTDVTPFLREWRESRNSLRILFRHFARAGIWIGQHASAASISPLREDMREACRAGRRRMLVIGGC